MRRRQWLLSTLSLWPRQLRPQSPQEYFPTPESEGGWRSLAPPNAEPSAAGKASILRTVKLDWDRLREAWSYCESLGGPHTVLVIRHGWIAAEWHNFAEPRGIASCTKSLTGVAMARLFELSDAGKLKRRIGIEDHAWQFLPPSWAEADPRRKHIRIRHMMTMSSGLDPYDGPYRDAEAYSKIVMERAVEAPPDAVWSYNSAPVDMLSLIVENVTGGTMKDFFHREIASPIGMPPIELPDFVGHTGGSGGPGGGARVIPRDLARVGYLLLRRGRWGERQLIAPKRVERLTTWTPALRNARFRVPNFWVTQPGSQMYYAHLFWTNRTQQALGPSVPKDAFYMSGYGMQACWSIPSLDMIVVRLGSDRELNKRLDFYREFLSRVTAAVKG